MKPLKHLFLFLGTAFLITACVKTDKPTAAPTGESEIRQKIATLYATYEDYREALYSQPIASNLFSADLTRLLQQAVDLSKADIERVAKSEYPTDKPALLEGSMFTSLYEGKTSYTITSMDIAQSVNPLGMQADVRVELENTSVSPTITWTDSIHLVHADDSGWRVANITFFKEIAHTPDLVSGLQAFIAANPQAKPRPQ
ncbi:hypothetical protein M2375_003861 [Comamonas sp. BIGb0152]|uniref:hypothetical protein n=1 Tax=Comamonas sp. BIGb0152 TaxID=2940601 RepID=UPI002168A1A2|nr:hypothetical protein [Comamonas sp. BIGb0152]MCS4295614.1 hypothetical protein [Comamonas sp. BIGb0152]